MRIASAMLVCVLSVLLAQCGFFSDPNAWPQKFKYGDSSTLATGANIRYVTERDRPIPSDATGGFSMPTMCTEPSPDVAIAFGRTLAVQATVNTAAGGDNGTGSVTAGSTEEATALAGRTAGVLALRDGLYSACQAYTNGILGQDAYAMVLSQYGNLLVALAGVNATGVSYSPYSPQDVALATLLVSCITEHDPTRLGAVANGRLQANPMLSARFCKNFLNNIASGKQLSAPKVMMAPPKHT